MSSSSRYRRVWIPLSLVAVVVMLACSSDDPAEPPPPESPTIREVVDGTGWFPEVFPDSTAWAVARDDSTGAGGEPLSCTDFEGLQTRALDRLTMLAPEDDLQFAGAILQWAYLSGSVPQAVLADRAGGTLHLTVPAGGSADGNVTVIDSDTVDAWRRAALDDLGAASSGDWQLTAGVVHNPDHLAVIAGVDPTGMTAEATARLAFRDDDTGCALVRLQRTHHTVACQYPGTATAAFADHVTGDDIDDQMATGNPPVWVAAVDHGEVLLVLVEAAAGPDTVAAAAVNSFAAGASGTEPDPGLPQLDDLDGVTVSVFALGADADAAELAFNADQQSLTDFLQAEPAAPADLPAVTADLEALRNGGPLVRGVSAGFGFTTCEVFEPVFTDPLWAFAAADAHTEAVMGDLTTDGEGRYHYDGGTQIYAARLVNRIPDLVGQEPRGLALPRGRRPFLLPEKANGRPAVELYELVLDNGMLYSELGFDGSLLVGREYTVFVVCALPFAVRLRYTVPGGEQNISQWNQANWFLHGTGEGVRHNMKVGYPTRQLLEYHHEGYLLQVPHRPTENEWHVYAMRFGINSGLSLFYDGELIDQDETDNYPLLEFSGATVCARWHDLEPAALSTFWLAEIIAYPGSGSDELVIEETVRLQEKYGMAP